MSGWDIDVSLERSQHARQLSELAESMGMGGNNVNDRVRQPSDASKRRVAGGRKGVKRREGWRID